MIFFKIYDAELFAPDGRFDRAGPYALRLTYLINAKKDRIVSQTVKEMKRQTSASNTQVESWIPLMERHFISMDKGTNADFIFQNIDRFFARDAQQMCTFTTAGAIDGDYDAYIDKHPKLGKILQAMQKEEASCLSASYWAILPFKLGDSQIVK